MIVASTFVTANAIMIFVQILFSVGVLYLKFGLEGVNPLLFAFIREIIAGPVLVLIAFRYDKRGFTPICHRKYVYKFLLSGFSLFINQFFAILGLKFTTALTASIWQPSQPIFTLAIAVLFGYENITIRKFGGIILAFLGCLFMILWSYYCDKKDNDDHDNDINNDNYYTFLGNICFLLNCTGNACFILSCKSLLAIFPPLTTTGASYIIASILMSFALFIFTSNEALLQIICSGPEGCGNGWYLSAESIGPLVFWTLFNSILALPLLNWSNIHLNGSLVSAYSVMIPLFTFFFSWILKEAFNIQGLLHTDFGFIGGLGIVIGLGLLIYEEYKYSSSKNYDTLRTQYTRELHERQKQIRVKGEKFWKPKYTSALKIDDDNDWDTEIEINLRGQFLEDPTSLSSSSTVV